MVPLLPPPLPPLLLLPLNLRFVCAHPTRNSLTLPAQVRMKDAVNEPHEGEATRCCSMSADLTCVVLLYAFAAVVVWECMTFDVVRGAGKRKNELTWKIHLIHWEKNRCVDA